jgi:ABC-type multidrug transport system ATPase subunit
VTVATAFVPLPALRTAGLTKRYGDRAVVDGVSISVSRGEVYGFLGPNGAGKTTTLRMVVGLVKPSSGSADVLGRPPGDPAVLARIGALVESPAFYPYLSGRDNLELLARHAGVARPRISTVLEMVGLADRADDGFGRYSLGMKQRLGVGAALLKDPELLILDEPTNGLDPLGMADMRALMRRLGDEGKAVLLSSHNLAEVEQICDRVGVIFNGKLITQSTVQELRGEVTTVVLATPREGAEGELVRLLGREKVSATGDEIRLRLGMDGAAAINRHLVLAGIDVHELRHDERSLEEVFMAMSNDYVNGRGGSDGR